MSKVTIEKKEEEKKINRNGEKTKEQTFIINPITFYVSLQHALFLYARSKNAQNVVVFVFYPPHTHTHTHIFPVPSAQGWVTGAGHGAYIRQEKGFCLL